MAWRVGVSFGEERVGAEIWERSRRRVFVELMEETEEAGVGSGAGGGAERSIRSCLAGKDQRKHTFSELSLIKTRGNEASSEGRRKGRIEYSLTSSSRARQDQWKRPDVPSLFFGTFVTCFALIL
jgi:hypothetical protein